MKRNNAFLDNLTRSSMRLNKGLLVLMGVALLLVGISGWAVQRLIDEQYATVRFHFARLMESVQHHETFLREVSQQSTHGELLNTDTVAHYNQRTLSSEGPHTYEGQEFPYSVPFTLTFNQQELAPSELPKVFILGVHLAGLYSAFWSASHYQSPQFFVFDAYENYNININIPYTGALGRGATPPSEPFNSIVRRVLRHLIVKNNGFVDGQVYWEKYNVPTDHPRPIELLAYVNIHLKPERLHIQGADTWMVAASLLNMDQVNNIERIMERSIYDHFSLTSPTGVVVIGSVKPDLPLNEGLNLNREGIVFKVSSKTHDEWTAIYTISFKSYFGHLIWPLIALLLTGGGAGWLISRWYRARVVQPAQQAHRSIAESEAFSRVVIDTAPTGLCVVRRSDFKVLLENQLAQQWKGTSQLVTELDRHCNLADTGETDLNIDGRHLHVGFISTRYQSQDVLLCAFNDITSHVEDAAFLEEARRSADEANEAKTLFLATMSHEIRTPLYGVLGTLELLALTHLAPRQQEYLQTIQRSSATLFQLISDVLDVSKIESGQMSIESIEFCPLDIIEDTLHTYAAFAELKGLLLYACIDATLPDMVQGDPVRIRQILNNLLSNAIKFTDAGRVVLRVKVLEHGDDRVNLEWQVTDSGIGISKAQQARLFDPFYQVRSASNEAGAGLGLAICYRLIEMMQGQLKVVSEPGLGSSFSLQLNFKPLSGVLPDCADIRFETQTVYVRAPVQELAQSVCDWLNRFGSQASLLTTSLPVNQSQSVLVDILPDNTTQPWIGPRILCLSNGGNWTESAVTDWNADLYDIRAIARSVCLVQQGQQADLVQPGRQALKQLHLNVLVAEDNPINQAIIKEQLEALGCTVVVASNGEQALHQWQPQMFDLVLTDVNMPLMSGYELARALRELDHEIPIIGVTANAMREEGVHCLEVGMNAWIVKPLSLQTLREHLCRLCKTPVVLSLKMDKTTPAVQPPFEQVNDVIELSSGMHELFISTMQKDILQVNMALERGDSRAVAEQLHSIAGAMLAVQARALAEACIELERLLSQGEITVQLAQKIQQLVQRLYAVLDSLD